MKKKLNAIMKSLWFTFIIVATIVMLAEIGHMIYMAGQLSAYKEMNQRTVNELINEQIMHTSIQRNMALPQTTYVGLHGKAVGINDDFPRIVWE